MEANVYQSDYMIEILGEERRREKYAEARQWRMFQEAFEKSQREPGIGKRARSKLAKWFIRVGQIIQTVVSARPANQARREECQTY
jgi:hypothetical protein